VCIGPHATARSQAYRNKEVLGSDSRSPKSLHIGLRGACNTVLQERSGTKAETAAGQPLGVNGGLTRAN